MNITRYPSRTVVVLVSLSAVAASCSTAATTNVDGAPVFALDRDVVAQVATIDPDRADVMAATDLRLVLQSMLTEHATLSNEAMRRAIEGDEAGLGATLVQLMRNTDSLTGAIGLVYGRDGARAFDQLWTNHIEFFNRYAQAHRSGDEGERTVVRGELDHYESDFSDFVEVATSGTLDFHTVLHVLHSHVAQLLEQADAWALGDYEAAFASADEAFLHMDAIAAALATGISLQQPVAFPGSLADPGHAECAAARLAVSHALTAAADVSLAEDANTTAMNALDRASITAGDLIDGGEATALMDTVTSLTSITDRDLVPAARTAALSTVADLSVSAC